MTAGSFVAVASAAVLVGCGAQLARRRRRPRARAILYYGCGSCHTIGGLEPPTAPSAPADHFRSDRYIAGKLPNTPANAASWIEHPQRYEPQTITPDLG